MSNKSRKKKAKVQPTQNQPKELPVNIVLPASLNAEEMQTIIANAILEVERVKEQRAKDEAEKEREELRQAFGYKDYSNQKRLKRFFLVLGNRVKMFFKLLFMPEDLIKGDDTTFGLLKTCLEMFFGLAKIITTLFALGVIVYIPLQYIVDAIPIWPIGQSIVLGMYAVLSFLLSRILRMASVEVKKIKDRNLLFGIFASITSIVSIVVAIVAIFQ